MYHDQIYYKGIKKKERLIYHISLDYDISIIMTHISALIMR